MFGRTRAGVFRRKGSSCFWGCSNNSGLMLLFWCTFSSVCSFFSCFFSSFPRPGLVLTHIRVRICGPVTRMLVSRCSLGQQVFFIFFTFSWKFCPSLSHAFLFVVLVIFQLCCFLLSWFQHLLVISLFSHRHHVHIQRPFLVACTFCILTFFVFYSNCWDFCFCLFNSEQCYTKMDWKGFFHYSDVSGNASDLITLQSRIYDLISLTPIARLHRHVDVEAEVYGGAFLPHPSQVLLSGGSSRASGSIHQARAAEGEIPPVVECVWRLESLWPSVGEFSHFY